MATTPSTKPYAPPTAQGFIRGAANGDIDILKHMLNSGMDVDRTDYENDNKGLTALVIAIRHGQLLATQLLLERGADPSFRVQKLAPLVHVIINTDSALRFVQLLEFYGASLYAVSGRHSWTALHWSAFHDRADVAEYIAKKSLEEARDPSYLFHCGSGGKFIDQ
jgi:ankyrin repeat protein